LLRSKPPDIWIKIGDFGLSKRVEDELGLTNTLQGTMGFIAPELHGFTSRETDYAPDIWALGEIAFQMLTKKPTFRNLGLLARYVHDAKLFPEDDLHEQHVHDQVIDFVRSTMCALPADRFTAQQGLEHPWILSFAPESLTPELPETERRVSVESVVEDLGAWTAFSAALEHPSQATKAGVAQVITQTSASSSSSTQKETVMPRKKVLPDIVDEHVEEKHGNKSIEASAPHQQEDALRRTIEVHGLASSTTEKELHDFFSLCGSVCYTHASFQICDF
jgi:serine/threonine protein kinase